MQEKLVFASSSGWEIIPVTHLYSRCCKYLLSQPTVPEDRGGETPLSQHLDERVFQTQTHLKALRGRV